MPVRNGTPPPYGIVNGETRTQQTLRVIHLARNVIQIIQVARAKRRAYAVAFLDLVIPK